MTGVWVWRRACRTFAVAGSLLWFSAMAAAQSAQPPRHDADVTFEGYRLRDGESVPRARIHYVTLGTPHRNAGGEIDNAVLLLHWTGNSGASLLTPEYMKALYASGAPLDASRYYLIIPDSFGHGQSTRPGDGLRAHFPHYGYADLVDLQHKLVVESLGVSHLHAIVGMSMGGMNAWQWAEAYPDAMDGIMPVVAFPARVTGRNLLWRRIVIDNIRSDPAWQRGDYTSAPPGFIRGFQVLRMMIDGVPRQQETFRNVSDVDAYMKTVTQQIAHADPNDLLYSLDSSQDYDPEPGLDKIKARVFALNFGDDEFNPDSLGILERAMTRVKEGRYIVTQGTPQSYGHLTMAHPAQWSGYVAQFMASLDATQPR